MGEMLTKLAIVFTGISLVKTDYLSTFSGFVFVIIGLICSFTRDTSLKESGKVRMLPGYGAIWFMVWIVASVFFGFINSLLSAKEMNSTEITVLTSFVAMLVRFVCVFCEGSVKGIFSWFGVDNSSLDKWN
jgi:cell division protein FtsW (lipid II flippase)